MIDSRSARLWALALLTAFLAACDPAGTTPSNGGKHLHVIGTWIGDEQAAFLAMVKPWETRSGNKVDYEPSRDLDSLLAARLQAGEAPDLAGLSGPGQMADLARAGKLVDLGNVLDMNRMASQYGPGWVRLGTVNRKLVGVFVKASINGLIFYDPSAIASAGLDFTNPPKTWGELAADADRIVSTTQTTPWCIGVESGAASGWPGADWIKDFFLREAGPATYEKWSLGQEPWTSPEMKRAWQSFGAIVNSASLAYGGKSYVLDTNFATAFEPMFQSPPGCYLHRQDQLLTQSIRNARPVSKVNAFGFPDVGTQYLGAQVVGGDLLGMFTDSPEARDLINYLTTGEAQQILVKRGGAVSPNKAVGLDAYPDPILRRAAALLAAANPPEFDVALLQSRSLQAAFASGVVAYIRNPGSLDAILNDLEKKRKNG
ncbi:MAG: ABC transporter substrate-binding protein [Candidatus Dormibacteraeota bacterium]|nr:ABC transporter substrate-binding protein [Candidatus Dormibacteraeota bacterium]